MPTISVLTPTRNRLHAVGELLESLSRQTFQDFEVVLVNDAGVSVTDVVDLYSELRIQTIDLPVASYHVWARNAGLPAARGEFVMPIDDIDLIVPDHMEAMLEAAAGADLVYGDVELVEYAEKPPTRQPTGRYLFAYDADPALLRSFQLYTVSGSLYRRSLHDELGPFDASMRDAWAWDWVLQAMGHGARVKKVPRAGALYAYDRSRLRSGEDERRQESFRRLAEKHGLTQPSAKPYELLLDEEALRTRRSASEIVWDGKPCASRYRRP